MDLLHTLLLVGAGFFGGILASVVGGASMVTYPALIAAGVSPVAAAVCTNTALVPSNFVAALADRSRLPPLDRAFFGLVAASIFGAGAGAVLLLATPEHVFALLVPLLLGFATVLFALSERISAWLRESAKRQGQEVTFSVTSLKALLPVSFYGGYFGAGVGVLLLGVLSIATGGNYRAANVTKNLVAGLNSATAASIYIVQGAVLWPQTLALIAGTVGGGFAGSWLARILPKQIVRVLVIAVGVILTVSFARRYWL